MGNGTDTWVAWMVADLRANFGKRRVTTLAKRYGKSVGAVYNKAELLGLHMPRRGYKHKWTADEMEYLFSRYADTPTADIAATLGMNVTRVMSYACNHGLRKSAGYMAELPKRRGARHAATAAKKREMKKL